MSRVIGRAAQSLKYNRVVAQVCNLQGPLGTLELGGFALTGIAAVGMMDFPDFRVGNPIRIDESAIR
jgi:hypothetical protein